MKTKSKIIKRIATGLMSVAMMVSMIPASLSISADTVKQPLIDKSKDGHASLTITKYEIEDENVFANLSHKGTGEQEKKVSEGGNIPNEAKTFKDVTFRISRIDTVDKYFVPDGVKLPTVTQAQSMLANADEVKTAKTDENGIAKFNNLKLGIYYVEEVSHPTQVTKETAPFLVSVPTTNSDGDDWLYDIYAYPKNQTKYADVSVLKMDSMVNKPLAGVSFSLKESVDNQKTWTDINNSEGVNSYTTDKNGNFTWKHLPSQRYYKINEIAVPDSKYILDNKTDYIFYINKFGQLEFNGTTDTTGKNTITINNDYVVPEKYILNTNGKTEANKVNTPEALNKTSEVRGKDAPTNIGSTVAWLMESNVPAEMKDMSTYDLVDTMGKGLTYKSSSVYAVSNSATTTLTKDTDYTVTTNGNKVTFSLTAVGIKKVADSKAERIDIYFNTVVNEEADLGVKIDNTVEAVYTNNINTKTTTTGKPETPNPETHTSGYQLKKVDTTGKTLEGVTFELYSSEADAKAMSNKLSFYTYDANGNKVKTDKAVSDKNGLVSFLGLSYGEFGNDETQGSKDYWVVETSTIGGYNLLKEPFKITVTQKSFEYSNTKTDVVNTPKYELPPTGMVAGATLGGLGIALAGVGLILMARKKKAKVNNK